jgi:hypothetical protein
MIGPVELEQVAMLLGLRLEQHRLDGFGPGQERAGVPPPGQVLLARVGQACRGVLAHRLKEPEPGPGPAGVRFQQRRGDQLPDERPNLAGPDRRCPRHLLRRGKVEPRGEYAQPPEYHRGISRQQRMTPGQARIQRVVTPGTRASGRPFRRTQLGGQFGQRGSPQAIGDQVERQRKPARLTADAGRKHQLSRPSLQAHPRHGCPGIKQRHRLRSNQMAGLAGNSHGLYPPHTFRLDIERDTARHQNPQIRGLPGQPVASTAGRFQNVFTVVENQQRPAIRHRLGDSIKASRCPGPSDPDPLNQGGNYLLPGTAGHQIDVVRPLRPPGRYFVPCRLNRQRGLSDSPDAGQRHYRVSAKPGGNLREVYGSPDKGEPSRWQPHRTVPAGITVTTGELPAGLRHQPTLTPWSEANQPSKQDAFRSGHSVCRIWAGRSLAAR